MFWNTIRFRDSLDKSYNCSCSEASHRLGLLFEFCVFSFFFWSRWTKCCLIVIRNILKSEDRLNKKDMRKTVVAFVKVITVRWNIDQKADKWWKLYLGQKSKTMIASCFCLTGQAYPLRNLPTSTIVSVGFIMITALFVGLRCYFAPMCIFEIYRCRAVDVGAPMLWHAPQGEQQSTW